MPTIYIDVRDPRVGVLLYYAFLAYPESKKGTQRKKFVAAMAAMRVKDFASQIGSRTGIPKTYTSFKNEKIIGAKNLACKRLAKRLSAGVVASQVCLGKLEPYVSEVRGAPASVSAAMRKYIKNEHGRPVPWDHHAIANAMHRVWAESLPVLHLSMTNPIVVKIVEDQLNRRLTATSIDIERDLLGSMLQPEWLRDAMEDADNLREILPDMLGTHARHRSKRGYGASNIVRLIPTEDPLKAYRFPHSSSF